MADTNDPPVSTSDLLDLTAGLLPAADGRVTD